MPSADVEATAVDSSVIIAALLGWHRDHATARRLLDAGLGFGNLLVPSRVLTESYSVLTRIPAPHAGPSTVGPSEPGTEEPAAGDG